ncbi:MAG: hypothetical protein NTW87_14530, partial [Planctomycetota bacterium]|nr:hypothetical protein [Planctomycetota bacterium]
SDGVSLSENTGYILHVEATDNAGNRMSAEVQFVAGGDTVAPTITIISPPVEGGTTRRAEGEVVVQDVGVGVDPAAITARLVDWYYSVALTPRSFSEDRSSGSVHLYYDLPVSATPGTRQLIVGAADRNKNYCAQYRDFWLAATRITIAVADTATLPQGHVTVEEPLGITTASVSISLDSAAPVVGGGVSPYPFQFPATTLAGQHTVSVTAYSSDGFCTTATHTFSYNPPPPMPVVDVTFAGTDLVTIGGRIPDSAPDLQGLDVQASGATVASIVFDKNAGTWQVALQKAEGSTGVNYSIGFKNPIGVSATPASGTQLFVSGTAWTPDSPPMTPPAGAVQLESGLGATIVDFDFLPEDIKGVTKPVTSDAARKYRGWIPATNLDAVRAVVTVAGLDGPFKIVAQGPSGVLATQENASAGQHELALGGLTEGLNKDIYVEVAGTAGSSVKSIRRSLYLDKTLPLADFPRSGWEWGYRLPGAYYHSEATATEVLKQAWNVDNEAWSAIEEEKTTPGGPEQSGIAKVEVSFSDDCQSPKFVLTPRDLEVDTYSTWGGLDFNRDRFAWAAQIPLLLPDGKPATGGGAFDIVRETHPWGEECLPSTPMQLKITDAAGNQTILGGHISLVSYYAAIPSTGLIETGTGYVVTSGEGTTVSGAISLEGNQVGVVSFDAPGGRELTFHSDYTGSETKRFYVYNRLLVVDENNDGKTKDEDPKRQRAYGVIVPINDDFEAGAGDGKWVPDHAKAGANSGETSLRLVMFDTKAFEAGTCTSVTLQCSTNVRMWRTNDKSQEIRGGALSTRDPEMAGTMFGRTLSWDFTNPDDRQDFQSMNGEFYIECLPDSREPPDYGKWVGTEGYEAYNDFSTRPPGYPNSEHRFIEICAGGYNSEFWRYRINIHGVIDKHEGNRDGQPVVAVGGPAAVDLASGALKCAWPLARSGSVSIPDITVYYNSRDGLSGEMNPRLRPVGDLQPFASGTYYGVEDTRLGELRRHFRHTLEMRIIRGGDHMILIEGDGTRIPFKPSGALPAGVTDEVGVVWAPETAADDFSKGNKISTKAEFSEIRTIEQTQFGMRRLYYALIRRGENRQYLFEKATGKLTEIRDGHDNWARLEYEEYGGTRGRLKRVVDNFGISMLFASTSDGDLTVTDVMGRTATVTAGGISGPLGEYPFELNPNGRIYTFRNSKGGKFIVNPAEEGSSLDELEETDVEQLRPEILEEKVSETFGVVNALQRVADSRTMRFEYQFTSNKAVVHHYSKAGDEARDYTYCYDPAKDYWTSLTYSTGTETIEQKQGASDTRQITSRTNTLQGEWQYGYDSGTGLLTSLSDPDKKSATWTYTNGNNPHYAADGPNCMQQVTRLMSATDGNGAATKYEYGESEFPEQITDTVGTMECSNWRSDGLPQATSGPRAGNSRTILYDFIGRRMAVTEYGGNDSFTTTYRADVFRQVREITFQDQRRTVQHFDKLGRLAIVDGPKLTGADRAAASAKGMQLTDGGYTATFADYEGNWLCTRDASGGTATRAVDEIGRVTSLKDATDAVTAYDDFDPLLQPATTELPRVTAGVARRMTTARDLLGRPTLITLPGQADGGGERTIGLNYENGAKRVTVNDPARRGPTVRQLTGAGRVASVTGPKFLFTPTYDGNGTATARTVNGTTHLSAVN